MTDETGSVPWHAMDTKAVFERLDSGEDGLDEAQAKQRLENTGPNSLDAEEGASPLRLLSRQVWAGGQAFEVSGDGYRPEGELREAAGETIGDRPEIRNWKW